MTHILEYDMSDNEDVQYAALPAFSEHKAMLIDKHHKRADEAKRFARTEHDKLRIDLAETAAGLRATLAKLDRLEDEGETEHKDTEDDTDTEDTTLATPTGS
jgi:hypothetical protein